jgi:hypothetical protein
MNFPAIMLTAVLAFLSGVMLQRLGQREKKRQERVSRLRQKYEALNIALVELNSTIHSMYVAKELKAHPALLGPWVDHYRDQNYKAQKALDDAMAPLNTEDDASVLIGLYNYYRPKFVYAGDFGTERLLHSYGMPSQTNEEIVQSMDTGVGAMILAMRKSLGALESLPGSIFHVHWWYRKKVLAVKGTASRQWPYE